MSCFPLLTNAGNSRVLVSSFQHWALGAQEGRWHQSCWYDEMKSNPIPFHKQVLRRLGTQRWVTPRPCYWSLQSQLSGPGSVSLTLSQELVRYTDAWAPGRSLFGWGVINKLPGVLCRSHLRNSGWDRRNTETINGCNRSKFDEWHPNRINTGEISPWYVIVKFLKKKKKK